jgi:hypothetical protein
LNAITSGDSVVSHTPPLPPLEAIPEAEREAYRKVVAQQTAYNYAEFVRKFPHQSVLRGMPGAAIQPYFAALLNSPLVAAGMSDLGVVYRTRGEVPGGMTHADREWIDMVVCHDLPWNWVLYAHALDAVAVGVRAQAISDLVNGREDRLAPGEKLRADFIRAVIRGSMTTELYRSLEAQTSVRACVEIAAFSAHLLKTLRLMQAFGIPDMPKEELLEFIAMILDGRVAPPDARERVPVAKGVTRS